MILRLVWWAVLAVLVVIASFAQIDRSARFQPELAELVPAQFSGFAAEQRTRAAIMAQQPDVALAEARQLVARRPLPAEHLGLLSLAAAMAGDGDQARAALEAASLRGWRMPVAQLAAGEAALVQEEYDIAAQRVAALMATGSMPDEAIDLAARLIALPEGQTAFARRLAARGHWQDAAITPLASAAAPADLAVVVSLAMAQGAQLDCGRISQIATRFAQDGANQAAQQLRAACAVS